MADGYIISDERGAPHRIEGCLVTPNTFSLIGQRPLLGRDFRADDAMPEADKVAILSYGLWQTRYGGDPSILGTAVKLSAESYAIVGIMPRDMEFPDRSMLWVPIVDTAAEPRLVVPPLRVRGDWPAAVCGAAATGRDGIARHRRAYCGQPFRTGRRQRAGRVALHRMAPSTRGEN